MRKYGVFFKMIRIIGAGYWRKGKTYYEKED
jgi:hypothetical protein